jgi:hypothetical protein
MLQALVFPKFNGYTHALPGFHALNRAIHPNRAFDRESRAKTGAHPENVIRLDEHSVLADVPCASPQPSRAPLDFQRGLIPVTRRSPALQLVLPRFPHVHGNGTITSLARKDRARAACLCPQDTMDRLPMFQTPHRDVLFPPFATLGTRTPPGHDVHHAFIVGVADV